MLPLERRLRNRTRTRGKAAVCLYDELKFSDERPKSTSKDRTPLTSGCYPGTDRLVVVGMLSTLATYRQFLHITSGRGKLSLATETEKSDE